MCLRSRSGSKKSPLSDLPANTPVFLISDLHLCAERPAKIALFARFMQALQGRPGQLWILGDLFESFWVGVDDQNPCNVEAIAHLRAYSDAGGDLAILRGNRDFLFDAQFAAACGALLLDEPVELSWGGKSLLLLHGDILCAQDHAYQHWRRFATSRLVGRLFMSLPLAWRKSLAQGGRKAIRRLGQGKPKEILDVDEGCVRRLLHERSVDLLIHGHTHRLGVHRYDIGGRECLRIVLGDWYRKDSVLVLWDRQFRLMSVEQCLAQMDRLCGGAHGILPDG